MALSIEELVVEVDSETQAPLVWLGRSGLEMVLDLVKALRHLFHCPGRMVRVGYFVGAGFEALEVDLQLAATFVDELIHQYASEIS